MIFCSIQRVIDCLKWLFVFNLILSTSNAFSQQINENTYTIYEKLPFSESEPQLTLDLFVPNDLSEPVPCIIVVQGGGFKSQDGQRFRYFAEYIAKSNYAAALISYRGRPDYTYQTTIEDIKSSVRYVRDKSSEYLINPDKIGTMGKSAGGTLAALLAVTENNSFDKGKHTVSSKAQAAVAYAGAFNFISRFSDTSHIALQPDVDIRMASNGEWIGSSFSRNDKDWIKASAINHLDKNDPPILFIHCKDDKSVPWPQSQEMHKKMKGLGISSEILIFEQGGHGFDLADKELYLSPMMSFFKKQFE